MSVEDGVSRTSSEELIGGLGDPGVVDRVARIEALVSMDPYSLGILTGRESIFSERMGPYWRGYSSGGRRGRGRFF